MKGLKIKIKNKVITDINMLVTRNIDMSSKSLKLKIKIRSLRN